MKKRFGIKYERYAAYATKLLRVFFLDASTRMNPNLKYAEFVPGKSIKSGVGIIDTCNLTKVVDAIGMLEGSASWTNTDQKGMESWFRAYLDWLLKSEFGQDESNRTNNHGTWYDAQIVSYSLFVGKDDVARRILAEVPVKRIATQIEPDGNQPQELLRTRSFHYSMFNLEALIKLAAMGQVVHVDLWRYKSPKGASIRKALDWMVPYAVDGKKWQYQEIKQLESEKILPFLRQAAVAYHSQEYERMADKFFKDDPASRNNLLYSAQSNK